ncbi:MAG: aminotransferase class I/II-fold pyridoxal phosphate-dependent enzyme [Acidimicrobiales bacterium]
MVRQRLYLSPPDAGPREREMLLDAFDSNWIAPLGPHVDAFEAEMADALGVAHAVALSSGTAALHLALQLVGVRRGDEVIVPTLTFIATAAAVSYLGARPVLLDSSPASWNLDPGLLDEELSGAATAGRLPSAVVAVDLYGQCADYEAIEALCGRYGVPLVEDAAEALGARRSGRAAGSYGSAATLSFNGNKIITTSGGGMLVSADGELIERARYLATQARDPLPHYEHAEVGYNYRLSNLLAALGRAQLEDLPRRVERRHAVNAFYREALGDVPGVELMPVDPGGEPNFWLSCLTIDPQVFGADREQVRRHLEACDIEARPTWKPMHLQPCFKGCRAVGGKVAEQIFERGLCLPSGSAMNDSELAEVVEAFLSCRGRRRSRSVDRLVGQP